jgi:hypothetical protein
MAISTHEISLHGFSGAIFWCVLSALIFYVLGFATVSWEATNNGWIGLWTTCSSATNTYNGQSWFTATQAMITIGLILLIAGSIAMFLYMFVHSLNISKNAVIQTFTGLILSAVVFMLIGFIIFGAKHEYNLNWSYAFSVIGGILSFVSGILAIVQMKQSNVF